MHDKGKCIICTKKAVEIILRDFPTNLHCPEQKLELPVCREHKPRKKRK